MSGTCSTLSTRVGHTTGGAALQREECYYMALVSPVYEL